MSAHKENWIKPIQILFSVSVVLIACHILGLTIFEWSSHWERLFHLDFEANVPTWFSSFVWILNALAAYRCSQLSSKISERNTWMVLSFFLLFLSCDEVASLHENVTLFLEKYLLRSTFLRNLDVRSWPILLGPLVVPFLLWAIWRLRECFKNSAEALRWFVLGGSIFLMSCFVMELLSIFMVGHKQLLVIEVVIEESLEMMGAIILLLGFLVHLRVLEEKSDSERLEPKICRV